MSISNIRIISANVNSLGDINKRGQMLAFWDSLKGDIICLSDTRFDSNSEMLFCNMTNYNCFFSSHNSQSRGVAILASKQRDFSFHDVIRDPEGNYIIIKIECDQKTFVIANIYGPNQDNPLFFETLFEHILSLNTPEYLITGDFNVTINHNLDTMDINNLEITKQEKNY